MATFEPTTHDPEIDRVEALLRARLLGDAPPTTRIGRYAVLERIGAGGMGVVYSAYDERLDRKLAIKLLHRRRDDPAARARLLREAQAMAKLSHANVVSVYEIGRHGDRDFVAIEFVQGCTLRQWQSQAGRTKREVLARYLQAARGLGAVHAAGLVHRDFKPDNVLVGSDERARVLDFGLVGHEPDRPDIEVTPFEGVELESALVTPLTRSGAQLGTPAYMAPEQIEGGTVDARSDQFAFCVALWEALAGERPFVADRREVLFKQVCAGVIRPPPGRSITRRVEAILRRGLSRRADDRWADVRALADALERAAAVGSWTWRSLAVASVFAVLALGYATTGARETGPCDDSEGHIAAVWNDARRNAVHEALLATGLGFAEQTWTRVEPALDEYVMQWSQAHALVCEAAAPDRWSERAVECLGGRLRSLRITVDSLAVTTDATAADAIRVATTLPPIELCANEEFLAGIPVSASDPTLRAQVESIRTDLGAAFAKGHAGHTDEALLDVVDPGRRARLLGRPEIEAEAELVLGQLELRAGRLDAAEVALQRAFFTARSIRAGPTASEAAAELIVCRGRAPGGVADARRWARHAEVELGGFDDGRQRADVLHHLGVVLTIAGAYDEALVHHEQALRLREQTLGADHIATGESLGNVGSVLAELSRNEEALEFHIRALATIERQAGELHRTAILARGNIGDVYWRMGRNVEARQWLGEAIALARSSLGPRDEFVANFNMSLGLAEGALGEFDGAVRHSREALDVLRSIDPRHHHLPLAWTNVGVAEYNLGDKREALAAWDTAFELAQEVLSPEHSLLGSILNNRAVVAFELGRPEAALALYQQANAIRSRSLPRDHPLIADTEDNIGDVLRSLDRPTEALSHHVRALASLSVTVGIGHPYAVGAVFNLADTVELLGPSAIREHALPWLTQLVAVPELDEPTRTRARERLVSLRRLADR